MCILFKTLTRACPFSRAFDEYTLNGKGTWADNLRGSTVMDGIVQDFTTCKISSLSILLYSLQLLKAILMSVEI